MYPIQVGVVSSINSTPQLEASAATETEQIEFSLSITGRESVWFLLQIRTVYNEVMFLSTVDLSRYNRA